METVTLGRTGITVNKNGFGALPIQRVTADAAVKLVRRAFDGGIRFFDTAHSYSDSEEKLGLALYDVRKELYLATKTMETTADGFWRDLEESLTRLRTDYIDLLQFHNPAFCPRPGDASGLYDAAVRAKEEGIIRHIGITNHRMHIAEEAIASELYETLQFPFSYLATEREIQLTKGCAEKDMGFIAMKSLSGGLIVNARAAYAFAAQFDNVLPIWGMQKECELDEFLSFIDDPPAMDEAVQAAIAADRKMLAGSFCRGCGYCMPCPAGIEISTCARMSLMLRRAPSKVWLSERWREAMQRIEGCLHCNACSGKCPYGLDTPSLLAENYKDYQEILAGKAF